MDQIPKAITGLIIMVLVVITCIGIDSVISTRIAAKDYCYETVNEIENSNFNSSVLKECIEEGKLNNYDVTIELFHNEGNVNTYSFGTDTSDVYMATVSVKYDIYLPFIKNKLQRVTHGIAR